MSKYKFDPNRGVHNHFFDFAAAALYWLGEVRPIGFDQTIDAFSEFQHVIHACAASSVVRPFGLHQKQARSDGIDSYRVESSIVFTVRHRRSRDLGVPTPPLNDYISG